MGYFLNELENEHLLTGETLQYQFLCSALAAADSRHAKRIASKIKALRFKIINRMLPWLSKNQPVSLLSDEDLMKLWRNTFNCTDQEAEEKIQKIFNVDGGTSKTTTKKDGILITRPRKNKNGGRYG